MNIALDTNRLVDFFRGDPNLKDTLRHPSEIFVPFIVAAELRAGFLLGGKHLENERRFTQFLGSQRCTLLFADEETTHQYARLFQQLRKRGTPIPINDIWIASLCLQHGLHLYTRDRHFKEVEQLSCSEN